MEEMSGKNSGTVPENENETKTRVYKRGASKLRTEISKELRVERIMQQISQEELAARVGTSKSGISRIESGNQNLTADSISYLAEALNKQAVFMLKDKGIEYGNETLYQLKLYDEELMRFKLKRDLGTTAEIVSVNEERKHLLPLDMVLDDEGVVRWLQHRMIPNNRKFVASILDSLGLTIHDTKGFVDISMALSLNDSYWVTPVKFDGTFDEYNLYENRFTEVLSLIAYTGGKYSTNDFRTSPELTTNGMLRKAWKFSSSKGIWLYKGGTEGFANTGNEPYSEFYASQIAEKMRLHAVKYELENWKGILASKCKLFTDKDTSYIPIGRIVRTGGIKACIEFYKELGDDFYQELASMLVFDAIILNEDRHFGNFGLMRDNRTGEIISPAPIFDNGISLLCYAMKSDIKDINEYIKTRSNPYHLGYISLAREVMGPVQKAQVRKLINFTFEESDLCNLPTWRLRALEGVIQERVQELLK